MKPIADILEDAARLIEKPGAWTQRSNAVDASGYVTYAADPLACRWCAYGAILRAGGDIGTLNFADDTVAPRVGSIIAFNDEPGRTQSEVVAKLRQAATLARGDTA